MAMDEIYDHANPMTCPHCLATFLGVPGIENNCPACGNECPAQPQIMTMNTNEPQFGEPWQPFGEGGIESSRGHLLAVTNSPLRDRAIACANLCAHHPDLSAVCVVERSVLEQIESALRYCAGWDKQFDANGKELSMVRPEPARSALATLRALLG